MAEAQLCPVCGGSGRLGIPISNSSAAATDPSRTCHGCGGLGWVRV